MIGMLQPVLIVLRASRLASDFCRGTGEVVVVANTFNWLQARPVPVISSLFPIQSALCHLKHGTYNLEGRSRLQYIAE
jgi:hypothetical protein